MSDLRVSLIQECANHGNESQHGWPRNAYGVSKAAMNTFTAILARENPRLLINSCCPGWVSTDMGTLTGERPPKTPGEVKKSLNAFENYVSAKSFQLTALKSRFVLALRILVG